MTIQQMLLVSGGANTGDWGGLSTGDTYQNGKVYKPNSTTFQIWYYPQSRKGSAVTYSMSNLTGGSFQVRQQSNMKIYIVGGGGGGTGENAVGGSGGGAITVNNFVPVDLETFTFQVGRGGRGGWSETSSQFSGMPSGNPAVAEAGGFSALNGTGLSLTAGGGPMSSLINQSSYNNISQATITIGSNSRGLSITSGSNGRGGSRNVAGQDGASGNPGGGGGNDYGNAASDDAGGDGSGDFGGGGGGGSGYSGTWSAGMRPGGTGGTYAFNGGYGGATLSNDYGQDGRCPTDNTTNYPNFHAGGGRAYKAADWSGLDRGSSGGGGFPGGGGGSSYYSPRGIGSDGASGIVVFHWTL